MAVHRCRLKILVTGAGGVNLTTRLTKHALSFD